MAEESNEGDTLIQHNPFSGQTCTDRLYRVDDFVGVFTTRRTEYQCKYFGDRPWIDLPALTVERISPVEKRFTCNERVFDVEEIPREETKDVGTGAGTWLSTYVMLPWLLSCPEALDGKRVLELGAGTGVVSIMASCNPFAVSSMTVTDHVPELMAMIERNVEKNREKLQIEPEVLTLDWNDDSNTELYDVIIACDCVYKMTCASFVAAVLRHLKVGGSLFLANPPEPGRPGVDQMVYAFQERGLVEMTNLYVTMDEHEDGGRRKEILLVHMTEFDVPESDPDEEC